MLWTGFTIESSQIFVNWIFCHCPPSLHLSSSLQTKQKSNRFRKSEAQETGNKEEDGNGERFSWHKAAKNIIYLEKIISDSASGIYISRDIGILERSSCYSVGEFNVSSRRLFKVYQNHLLLQTNFVMLKVLKWPLGWLRIPKRFEFLINWSTSS